MSFCSDVPSNPGGGSINTVEIDSGGTYESGGLSPWVFRTTGAGIRLNDDTQGTLVVIATDVPTEDDHYFETTFNYHSNNGQEIAPVINWTSGNNWYMASLSSNGDLALIEVVTGTPTTHDTATVSLSGTHTLGIGRRNSATTPVYYANFDGNEVMSFEDSTPRTGVGQVGIFGDAQGATTGDDLGFTVTEIEGLDASELGGGGGGSLLLQVMLHYYS